MSEPDSSASDSSDEAVVRHYLLAWNNGQVLDVLNAFSMNARLRDVAGRERHGIREIAKAFAGRERQIRLDIEDLRREGDTVAVRMRLTSPKDHTPRTYRSVFRVSRDRIESLEIVPVPLKRMPKHLLGKPA